MEKREKYYLCRWRWTDKIREGKGFHTGDVSLLRLAPSYVYKRYRDGGPLFLTKAEAFQIDQALSEEGCPHLLPEVDAIEGEER